MTCKIITIDGPSGVGKGTVALMVAEDLSFNYLDSGSLYRSLALKLYEKNNNFDEVLDNLDYWMSDISIDFQYEKGFRAKIFVNNEDFTEKIRTEKVAELASSVAKDRRARDMLEIYQRKYLIEPGLVADGRDMGTVIFSDAKHKIFLTASAEERAKRRQTQLKRQGLEVNMRSLLQELEERDRKDTEREHSPLIPAEDSVIIDTSNLNPEGVVKEIKTYL